MDNLLRGVGVALAAAMTGTLARGQSTERVSVSTNGTQANGYTSYLAPSISAEGRYVAFPNSADNLVPSDTNQFFDIFLRDRWSGTTIRVSLDSAGAQANGASEMQSISGDGRFVAFDCSATNLVAGDTNGALDVFVRDLQTGTTERVSVNSLGVEGNVLSGAPSISFDGRYVAFLSYATNLVPGDTNGTWDIFVRDRQSGTTERASVATGGAQANNASYSPAISANGRFVVFGSDATNLVSLDFSQRDVFLRDLQLGTTEKISVTYNGSTLSHGERPSVSGDGRVVAFQSDSSNLVPGDTNARTDIFVRDRQTATTERVSVSSGGAQANDYSWYASISGDGSLVTFQSQATNLIVGDGNGFTDIFVRDRRTGTTERASVDSAGAQTDGAVMPAISADGRFVAFVSGATNLVPGDTNGTWDAFVRDRGIPPPMSFCLGDGSAGACPCGNTGAPGSGCENSASSGGARLSSTGSASLTIDSLVLSSSGELATALSIVLQGDSWTAPASFGDGLLCVGGTLEILYVRNASAGVVIAPQAGDPTISVRSAALGDVLTAGAPRYYQTYYRDPVLAYCSSPQGNNWNVSTGLVVVWAP